MLGNLALAANFSLQMAVALAIAPHAFAQNVASPNLPGDNAASACDLTAAFPYDNDRKATGVSYEALNPNIAIAKCSAAVSRNPNTGRFYFQLGRALEKANKVAAAIEAYRRAAELGHGGGYNNLGELYRDGKSVKRNLIRAQQLFQQGSSLNYPEAEFNLATLLLHQSRDPSAIEQARSLLTKAVSAGYTDASRPLQALAPIDSTKPSEKAEGSEATATSKGDTNSPNASDIMKDIQVARSQASAAVESLTRAADPTEGESAAKISLRMDKAHALGEAYAKEVGTAFTINQKTDEMTDSINYTVEATQKDASDIEAVLTGTCKISPGDSSLGLKRRASINFTVLVLDPQGKPTVNLTKGDGEFLYRIDDTPAQQGPPGFPLVYQRPEYSNELGPLDLSTLQVQTGWRLLISADTDRGQLLVKIPLQDDAVQKLAALCK